MEEKPKVSYEERYDYQKSFILAILGTIPGLAFWIYAASKGIFFVYILFLIALMVFFGARFRQPKKQFISLMIAIFICVLAMAVGDMIESTILYGRTLELGEYLNAMLEKYKGFRILQYLIALGMAISLEFAVRRVEERGLR